MRSQLSTCYSVNRLSATPVSLIYTSFNGQLKRELDTFGTSHEAWAGIEWWEEGYEELWSSKPAGIVGAGEIVSEGGGEEGEVGGTASTSTEKVEEDVPLISIGSLKGKPRSRALKSDVIYLSGDSPNILTTIDRSKTYIIGGIVDKNRYKSLCLDKAISQGIAHAQLPLGEFLPQMGTRRVLTVNHVVEIIVKWVEMKDWEKAFLAVMPQRKFKVDENNGPGKGEQKKAYVAKEGEEEEEDEDLEIVTEAAATEGEQKTVYVAQGE